VLGVGPAGCATPVCNGRAALCDVPLPEVTFPGTHNAMSNSDDGWFAPDQQHPPRQQLADGVRAMLLDTYEEEGEAVLCHGFCSLGQVPFADVLGDLRGFLESEPGEVLILVLQDGLSIDATLTSLSEAGLDNHLIAVPTSGEAWPTLGELVAAQTRLLVTRESGGPGPATYAPFYEHAWDTPYSFSKPEDFSCDLLRGKTSHAMFQINHWISDPLPRLESAEKVNTVEVLGQRVNDCLAASGRLPTILAVDFYATGGLFEVVGGLENGSTRSP
jgi:hypothetical protein